MNGHWNTVYEIASKRHHTRLGENHLSEKALYLLQCWVAVERQEAMQAALFGLGSLIVSE